MRLVVDASVALKWFFRERADEADSAVATEILGRFAAGELELIAPVHFTVEVCAVLVREMPDTMNRHRSWLEDLSIPVRDDPLVLARAMQLAHRLDHHLFDTLYHALALEDEAVLVTADRRYSAKAKEPGGIIELSRWTFDTGGGSPP